MSSAMNERHAFAQLERHLAREDPELARRINAINSQFTDLVGELGPTQSDQPLTDHTCGRAADQVSEEDSAAPPEEAGNEHSWTAAIATVLAVMAIIGLLLTGILLSSGGGR